MDPLDAANLALGLLDPAIALADRYAFLRDPLLIGGIEQAINQYNQYAGGSPYGSPETAWGGMFGFHEDGTPVGYGEAQARMLGDMLGMDPSQSTIANYQALLGQQRPGMVDETAGMAGLLGRGGAFGGGYDAPTFAPQTTQMPTPPGPGSTFPNQPAAGQPLNPDDIWAGYGILDSIFGGGGGDGYQGIDSGGFTGGQQPASGGTGSGSGRWSPFEMFAGGGGMGGGNASPAAPATPSGAGLPWLKSAQGGQPQPGMLEAGGNADFYRNQQRRFMGGGQPQPKPGAAQPQPQPSQSGWVGANNAWAGQQAPQTPAPQPQQSQPAPQQGGTPWHQLMANPVSFTDAIKQNMLRTGQESINQQAAGARRQMLDTAAPGVSGGGAMGRRLFDLEMNRQNAGTQLGRDIETQSAIQNRQDLAQAAGMQGGMEQALAGITAQGNAMRQGLYDTDFTNQARVIDTLGGLQNQEMARRMQLMQQLQGLGQQDMGMQQGLLDRIMRMEAGRLQPSPVSQMPTISMGGYGGYPTGGGGQDWAGAVRGLSGLMGQWFGPQNPSLWT